MAIVCGTDFTAPAAIAARAAVAVAARLGTRLRLVHVREPLAGREIVDEMRTAEQRARTVELRETAAQLATAGVTVDWDLRAGMPDEELAALAEERGASLVVVGALGRRCAPRWALGSVAERTVFAAAVPVLVVRAAEPFESWARGDRALRVLAAAAFSAGTQAALAWLATLRAKGTCDVVVAHVPPPSEAATAPHLEQRLTEQVGQLAGEGTLTLRVAPSSGAPVTAILEIARAGEADLVVVGTHQRRALEWLWHGSFSRELLHRAETNVACIPMRE